MSKKHENIIHPLKKIRQDIDAFGLNDPGALIEVCTEFNNLIQLLPLEMEKLIDLFNLCAEGLKIMSEDKAADPLASVDAIIESLEAGEHYLMEKQDKDIRVHEAHQLLESVMSKNPGWMPSKAIFTHDLPVDASLNDAAAMLIQLEPDDFYDLDRLRELLEIFCKDKSYTEKCLERILQACQKITKVIEAADDDPDSTIPDSLITEVGLLLEEAMIEMGQNGQIHVSEAASPKIENKSVKPVDDTDYMPEDADLDLIEAFIAESNDLITNAEDALLDLETNPEDMEAVSTVFRAFHNIKGTSAFFELSLMTEMAHHAESLLSRVREKEIRYAGGYPDLALRSVDMLKELFRGLQEAIGGSPFMKPNGYDDLMELLSNPEKAGISDQDVQPEPVAEEEVITEPPFQEAEPEIELTEIIQKEQKNKPAPKPKLPAQSQASRQTIESSIRVPIDRLDRFIDMVGELVVSHSMVVQDEIVSSGEYHELQKKVTHTSKIVRELQNMSMSMRMIPLKTTFRKMARLVRDLSRKIGKDVTFITEGEDTEIDRNMVDIINDPLVHMVRNALDHGIEMPDERERKGKPRYGTVHLSAYHSAGNVVVEIKDDGKGLDKDAIIAKAKERELIDDISNLNDRDIYNLIFEPGFSTAKNVSDVSGRGVGMDVVKKNIENIRGHVEIYAKPGKGSTFKMSLPLTLAIIDGMVVRVGSEKYVIPTISIIRSVQPDMANITSVLKKGEMLTLQGDLIPLFRLGSLFQVEGAVEDISQAIAVVVENDGQQAGLLVDELIGSQQIVIKTLGETLGNILGISGSAIMPDGRVGLILDVGGLVRLANTEN